MEQCTSHLVPHFEGYPAVVKENCQFMFWSLVETGMICSFLGAGFLLLSWLMLGFFSKHPSQCCFWKQVSSVIRSGGNHTKAYRSNFFLCDTHLVSHDKMKNQFL